MPLGLDVVVRCQVIDDLLQRHVIIQVRLRLVSLCINGALCPVGYLRIYVGSGVLNGFGLGSMGEMGINGRGSHPEDCQDGNSGSDFSMAQYVLNDNPYKAKAFMLCCDDTERENGNEEKAQKMVDLCAEFDWVPVSMKNDWTTIYGDGVTKIPNAQ